jgi:hypothetical protein
MRVTETLSEIRQTIDRIEVKINFQHIWFPQGKFHSFWSYYNKINIESEKADQAPTIRRFLSRQVTPCVADNEGNQTNIKKLKQLCQNLIGFIRDSRRKCCCIGCDSIIFGRHD